MINEKIYGMTTKCVYSLLVFCRSSTLIKMLNKALILLESAAENLEIMKLYTTVQVLKRTSKLFMFTYYKSDREQEQCVILQHQQRFCQTET